MGQITTHRAQIRPAFAEYAIDRLRHDAGALTREDIRAYANVIALAALVPDDADLADYELVAVPSDTTGSPSATPA